MAVVATFAGFTFLGWSLKLGRFTLFGMKALPNSSWRYGFVYTRNGPTYSLRIGDRILVLEGDD